MTTGESETGRETDGPDGRPRGGVAVETRPPEAAFALLGDETRVRILRALAELRVERGERAASFSELRERVGVRDSGRFNYHLGKLVDSFVRRVDGGYELTLAGSQVVGALHAGTYTASAALEPIPLEGSCPRCGEGLAAEYADERVRIACRACEQLVSAFSFPPGSLDQFSREELPSAFDRWVRTEMSRTVAGFCSNCAARVEGRLLVDEWAGSPEGAAEPHARYDCGRCGGSLTCSLGGRLLHDQRVLAFFSDRGVDVNRTRSWELFPTSEEADEVVSTDPLRARTAFTVGGERLVVTVDERLGIVDSERTGAE